MVVPTDKLLEMLDLSILTTPLQPLSLSRLPHDIPQPQASLHSRYIRAFRSSMAKSMAEFQRVGGGMLQMEEMGVLRQGRASNGELVWSEFKEGEEILRRNQVRIARAEASAVARRGPGIKKGLKLEIEVDDENILLVRENELPLRSEILDALEISNEELLTLFETATALLANTKSEDHMRAYADRDAGGNWQVRLLPP